MRNSTFYHISIICIACFLIGIACDEATDQELRQVYSKPINPNTQQSELSLALGIDGLNTLGDMPDENLAQDMKISSYQPTATVTSNNFLFIPFIVDVSTQVANVYVQIAGAKNFWKIPLSIVGNNHTLRIGIPANVLKGDFILNYQLENSSGLTSERLKMEVEVLEPVSNCSGNYFPQINGEDGVTNQRYVLQGDEPAEVSVEYYMYTVPDRIDIRYGGEWIYSSGSLLTPNESPVFKRCAEVVSGDGFLGGGETFTFTFDPQKSRDLDVYVSGCLDGGTAWNFRVSCPQGSNPNPFNQWYSFLPGCPCNYQEVNDGEKTQNPNGEWLDCGSDPGAFHYGAAYEVRWAPDIDGAPGQQCTYDSMGKLITSGIAGGSPDLTSPGLCGHPLLNSLLLGAGFCSEHCEKDVRPWQANNIQTTPCIVYLSGWPANNEENCIDNPVNDIQHMLDLIGLMSCQEITWLYEIVDDPDNGANGELVDYIHGQVSGVLPSNELVSTWLLALRNNMNCQPDSRDRECRVLEQAWLNLNR